MKCRATWPTTKPHRRLPLNYGALLKGQHRVIVRQLLTRISDACQSPTVAPWWDWVLAQFSSKPIYSSLACTTGDGSRAQTGPAVRFPRVALPVSNTQTVSLLHAPVDDAADWVLDGRWHWGTAEEAKKGPRVGRRTCTPEREEEAVAEMRNNTLNTAALSVT
jgi:hypothetical protein